MKKTHLIQLLIIFQIKLFIPTLFTKWMWFLYENCVIPDRDESSLSILAHQVHHLGCN